MSYRYSASSDWGEIFGLSPTDLEPWQLKKINIRKLVEFASTDPRVEKIIGDVIVQATNYITVKTLHFLQDNEFNNLPYIKAKYNECIALNSDVLEKVDKNGWDVKRDEFVWWNRLSSGNKSQEFIRWLDGKSSIIKTSKINFNWLNEKHNWLMDSVILKVFRCVESDIIRMIPDLPEAYILRYLVRIFKCSKSVYIHSLSNIYTPRCYIIKSLREIAGRKHVPNVRVTLNKSILLELPPVMRLQILESLLIYMRKGNVKFSDINTEEDLTALLFGTAIKYNQRVRQVVQRFNRLCK